MRKVAVFTIFLALALTGHAQSDFGIQLDLGSNSITQISGDTIVPFGYSAAMKDAKSSFQYTH